MCLRFKLVRCYCPKFGYICMYVTPSLSFPIEVCQSIWFLNLKTPILFVAIIYIFFNNIINDPTSNSSKILCNSKVLQFKTCGALIWHAPCRYMYVEIMWWTINFFRLKVIIFVWHFNIWKGKWRCYRIIARDVCINVANSNRTNWNVCMRRSELKLNYLVFSFNVIL